MIPKRQLCIALLYVITFFISIKVSWRNHDTLSYRANQGNQEQDIGSVNFVQLNSSSLTSADNLSAHMDHNTQSRMENVLKLIKKSH